MAQYRCHGNIKATKNFYKIIEKRIRSKHSITIYPEAHIWPYYTKIRPFKSVSFKYPVELNVPIFTLTNTYQEGKNGKIKITSYIDGPFFVNTELSKKDAVQDLRDMAYDAMTKESKNSTYEHIIYKEKEKTFA